tara:strand:- start:22288 stop:22500 length:213 start_codon:yes stop_codon:yes gene_type:complete
MSQEIYKRFSSGESALKYIQERVEDWEMYLNDFAEGDWQTLEEVTLRGIADGLAESDAELADGTPNPDAI